MLETSFGLFFFLKQPKNQKNDERYVYLRITVDGVSKELSTKHLWNSSRWDQGIGRAKGAKEDALTLNAYLSTLTGSVYSIKSQILNTGRQITAELIKDFLLGKGDEKRMLLDVFTQHNKQLEALVGMDYVAATLQRYRTAHDHTKGFIQWKYNQDDLDIQELNYDFVSEFAFWLKSVRHCCHNTTMKYISNLKKVVLQCIRKGWLKGDPFINFKTTRKEVVRVALTNDELFKMATKTFTIERLRQVRDIFLFSCYTGLAYIDVKNLRRTQIIKGVDGEDWIITKRQKTDSPTRLPLLPVALEIMNSYENHPKCKDGGYVLPVLTNQKMNSYLKEIADNCGINKDLTFHIARHTFATTVLLSNGVPIESVSKMLGHKSIKQTQQYAKILDLKISADMQLLKSKLAAVPGGI